MSTDTETTAERVPTDGIQRLTKDDFTTTYTINMRNLGEDGEHFVAYSHIEPARFVDDLRRYNGISFLGLDDDELFQRTINRDFADVRHEWAVLVPSTGTAERTIQWRDVTEETPGAFPITRLSFDF